VIINLWRFYKKIENGGFVVIPFGREFGEETGEVLGEVLHSHEEQKGVEVG